MKELLSFLTLILAPSSALAAEEARFKKQITERRPAIRAAGDRLPGKGHSL